MATIGDMLCSVDKEATLAALDALYDEDQRDDYERVWDNLLSLHPAATTLQEDARQWHFLKLSPTL